jgi:hypothetical protein
MSKKKNPNSRWVFPNARYDEETTKVIYGKYPRPLAFFDGSYWHQGARITLTQKQQHRRRAA